MKLVVMIEGQEDVSWADWQRLATLTEELGFDALMRSDHYLSVAGAKERRADLGMGTGWFQGEHDVFGLDLPPMDRRFGQLEQQVAGVHRFWMEIDAGVGLSMMTGFAIGTNGKQADERRAKIKDRIGDGTRLIGTPDTVVDQIQSLADAGLDRIMLQHHLFTDDDRLRLVAEEALPRV